MSTELTRTQRAALAWLREHPNRGQWPAGRGRWSISNGPDSQWSERTLQALVDAGLARWRGSTYETPVRHGVMPYVQLTENAADEVES